MKVRLGILSSHQGSHLKTILDAIAGGSLLETSVAMVISNNRDARVLAAADAAGLTWHHLSSRTHEDPIELDNAICETLGNAKVDLVLLLGYMKLLGQETLRVYQGRILNIHPSLLPSFGGRGMHGMRVHEAVLASGASISGATLHLVDEVYDHGRIIKQAQVAVAPGDTAALLSARVIDAEKELIVQLLSRVERELIKLPLTM